MKSSLMLLTILASTTLANKGLASDRFSEECRIKKADKNSGLIKERISVIDQILELQAQLEKVEENDYAKKSEISEQLSELFNKEIAVMDEVIALSENTHFCD